MIPGLKHRTIETDLGGGLRFIVHIPDTYYTMAEADNICKRLRKSGYYCGVIYQYRHRINGKSYVGQTMYPRQRHTSHINAAENCSNNSVWGKALKKYGTDSFSYIILDIVCDRDEQRLHDLLDEREKHFINWYHSSVKEYGYNVAPGGWKKSGVPTNEKRVNMFDMSGKYIKTFPSLAKANAQLGFTGSSIRQVCNHIHQSAGGYLWAWAGEQPKIPSDNKIYAYNENGEYVAEYDNAFAASKKLGNTNNGGVWVALKDKFRIAYGMYWRTYKADRIPFSDFPKAVYAYDTNGNFVRGFINLAHAKEFIGDSASSGISHAIIRKTAHKGYLWRTEYLERIDPTEGRFINKAPVIAIFPDGTRKRYTMIKEAAIDTGVCTSSIQRSIKKVTKTAQGIQFIRVNE